ncbi:hypothetical protein GQ43DRAFT_40309 [Delitschia confertaspora ATCC 74209]|uniref:Uncharacterized protein n=1 Tax=Delitschia confertaspora ATCC 74209 TaxID=1513339 RepID=A0A9P4JLJ8_9PLEO|nr:hypothetical protein GQ43DRAFT_40309 [Delitschia confertaspora ATCC 74209]
MARMKKATRNQKSTSAPAKRTPPKKTPASAPQSVSASKSVPENPRKRGRPPANDEIRKVPRLEKENEGQPSKVPGGIGAGRCTRSMLANKQNEVINLISGVRNDNQEEPGGPSAKSELLQISLAQQNQKTKTAGPSHEVGVSDSTPLDRILAALNPAIQKVQEDMKIYMAENSRLKEALKAAQAGNKALSMKFNETKLNVSVLIDDGEKLKVTLDHEKALRTAAEELCVELSQEKLDLVDRNTKLKTEHGDIQKERAALERKLRQETEETTAAKKEKEEVTSKLDDEKRKYSVLENSMKQERKNLHDFCSKVTELKSQIKAFQEEKEALQDTCSKVADLKSQAKRLKSQVEALQEQNKVLQESCSKVADLQVQVKE